MSNKCAPNLKINNPHVSVSINVLRDSVSYMLGLFHNRNFSQCLQIWHNNRLQDIHLFSIDPTTSSEYKTIVYEIIKENLHIPQAVYLLHMYYFSQSQPLMIPLNKKEWKLLFSHKIRQTFDLLDFVYLSHGKRHFNIQESMFLMGTQTFTSSNMSALSAEKERFDKELKKITGGKVSADNLEEFVQSLDQDSDYMQ